MEKLFFEALNKRNYLTHVFFRENTVAFITPLGRRSMISELDICAELFEQTESTLNATLEPVRIKAGITDQMVHEELERLLANLIN